MGEGEGGGGSGYLISLNETHTHKDANISADYCTVCGMWIVDGCKPKVF